ncbi:MAG: hypothetical protein FWF81_01730, partial [Defluviitaleaceae bacterium]|nr:hypothetical protein [Defluviitaleaceae bacterium]
LVSGFPPSSESPCMTRNSLFSTVREKNGETQMLFEQQITNDMLNIPLFLADHVDKLVGIAIKS